MKNLRLLAWCLAVVAVAVVVVAGWRSGWPNRGRQAASGAAVPAQATAPASSPAPAAPTAPTETRKVMANFDRRAELPGWEPRQQALATSRADRQVAAARLLARVPGVRVDFDEALGSPKFIASTRGFLATADGKSGAVSEPRLAQFAADDPQRLVKAFLEEHSALFGHGAAVLAEARLVRDYETAHSGLRTYVWQQQLEGVRVFESTLQAHVTKNGELVNVASRLVPDPAAAAPNHVAALAAPAIDVKTAISSAGENVGENMTPAQIAENAAAEGPSRKQQFRSTRLLDVSAEFVWLPEDETTLRLCWEVIFTSKARGEMFRSLVDAATGEVVVRQCLTNDISNASYRVFTSDSPAPMSPGHASPSSVQAPFVARTLVTTPALNTTASPNGWIDDGVTETRGNNVDAHTDTNADNVADTPRPQGGVNRVFDFPIDFAQAPSNYKDAAVTQLFYWCNFMHDRLYELGFTEATGNFQNNNFGRGGLGNDAVQADAQDGSGTDNANFSTPPDGSPGRVQMFLWTGPNPDIDGDFDAEVLLHEYTHGLTNRLVGGGVGISALQSGGMGEGWSDFYGLAVLAEAGDDIHGNWARGAYSRKLLSGTFTENYYFGGRRYPYSTNLSKNPLTFKDIDPTQADPHTGIPRHPLVANTADQVHNIGNVWCVTLWEVRANLITKHGFAVGNELTLQLVTDGLKLSPANPNFLQARDGILQAELVLTGGANRAALWAGFAKRGMGLNATSPASSTTVGLVENYDLPDDLAVSPTALWSTTGPIGGPFPGTNSYTLTNTGSASLNWTAAPSQPWLVLSVASGTLAPGASTTVVASIGPAAGGLIGTDHPATITFTNVGGVVQTRGVVLTVEPIKMPIATETWESGAVGSAWTITGTNTHRTIVTTANGPHGGSYHLTMDSSTNGTLSRNEATWTVNLAGRSNVRLEFWVKMFTDEPHGPPATSPFTPGADFDGVAISANGTAWYEVLPLRTAVASWTRYTVDLDAAIAARSLSYNSTFRIRFNHYDDFAIGAGDGFAFDDILIYEAVHHRLSVSLPTSAGEGAGTVGGTFGIAPAPESNLTVNLTSSAPGQASVPASVVVPAGQTSAPFTLMLVDDALLDGTQPVTVTAAVAGYVSGAGTIAVEDNETAVLTLSLPASSSEGASPLAGTVTASAAPDTDVVVTLASSRPAEFAPTTVTLPAGQTSVNFNLPVIDDPRIDGAVTTTITAQVANWTPGSADITVADNENTTLVVNLPASVREGNTPAIGTVQISGTLPAPLTVALGSSDETELTVPASVTIAAGQTSANFSATIVNDTDPDGAQPVTVTASAAGFADGTAGVSVDDNDAHHFTFTPITSPQVRGAPVAVTITAKDVNDAPIANYNSTVALTAAGDGGAVPVSPASVSAFVNGVWTGNATVGAFATNVVLTVDDGAGHTGASNPFDVGQGSIDRFAWNTIASPQTMDTPFTATITAHDAGNNPVTSFAGSVNLSAFVPALNPAIGTGTNGFSVPFPGSAAKARQQAIYLASEMSGPARLASLSLYFTSGSAGTFNNFTIRLKHTALSSYATAAWESTGWTVVHQSNATPSVSGWRTFTFSTPFEYDGTSNLLVDFSFNNPSANNLTAFCRYTPGTTIRMVSGGATSGDPLTWSAISGPAPLSTLNLPNVQFAAERAVAMRPAATGAFSGGVWTGEVSVPFAASSVRVSADDGAGHRGVSNLFAVDSPAGGAGGSGTVFVEDFESGAFGSAWTITGTNTYRTQITTANTPRAGLRHMTMDSSSAGAFARNEATLTLNLTGRSGVQLTYWAKMFSDEAHGPPASPFTTGADFDGVAISADGITWWEVQGLRSPAVTSAWAQLTVNLDAAIAARGIEYNSAFKIRFNQYDDNVISTDGIAIDDIAVTATPLSAITVNAPAQAVEGAGVLQGTVTLPFVEPGHTVVALVSNSPAKVAVPASVTVPAEQFTANFTLTVLDDAVLDGHKPVAITASASGMAAGSATITVLDNEIGTLALSIPASVSETAGTVPGTLTLAAAPASNVVVTLVSSDPAAATVPASVTFPVGQTSVVVPVTIVNDTKINGTHSVTITASVSGWTSASGTIAILDNENTDLALTLAATTREGDAPLTGTVSLSGSITSAVVVDLASTDTTELTVPASVTIPAGATSATFSATPVDDTELDGVQTATVSASAAGFTGASKAVTISDNDAHHFALSAVPASILRGAPFTLTVTARDANGATVTNYSAPTNLLAAAGATALSVTPATLTGFVNGVWTGQVKVNDYATGVVLTVDSGGRTGTSNSFDVGYGQVVDLAWSTIASPQYVDAPFPVRIRAVDAAGNSVPTFTGTASIAGIPAGATVTSGTGSSTGLALPFYGVGHDVRTQTIHLASDLGGAATFTGLALNVSGASASAFTNFTVRVKHTPLSSFSSAAAFEATGWTEVYRASVTPSTIGWLNLPFTVPFAYDGVSNLLVDFSFDDSSYHNTASVYYTSLTNRSVYGYSDSMLGDPRTWSGSTANATLNTAVANIRFTVASQPVVVVPTATGAFVAGEWSGEVTVPAPETSLKLRVTSGAFTEDSNAFAVATAVPPSGATVVFSDDFESGALSGAWTVTGAANYRTQVSTYSPRAGTRHLAMDEGGSGTFARNEATLTFNLVGRTGVQLHFWAVGFGEDNHGPPPSPFPAGGADFDGVAISADGGTNWYEVQGLRSLTGTYAPFTVNLDAALAARGLAYSSNFKIRFNQYDDSSLGVDGIGIDDILITATAPASLLSVTLPAQVTEGAGVVSGSVSVTPIPAADLVVHLSSKSPAKITVPATVTIPAGQPSANFPFTVLDDSFVDGPKNVVITAAGAGNFETGSVIQVLDNDGGVLLLTLPASAMENAGSVTGTLSLSVPPVVPLTVVLASDNPAAAQVPATVIVPPGATSVTFSVTLPDDGIVDGNQPVQISANFAGWTTAMASLLVQDNEARTLTVTIPSAFREADAPKIGTISLAGTAPADLVVALSSSDPTAVTVPASATIPAGLASVSFPIAVQDDTVADGAQPFTITASAATFTAGAASGQVRDNEAHHFTFAPIGSPQVQNGPIPAIVTARDALGAVLTDYNSTITLTAAGHSGPLTVTPVSANAFIHGVWNGSVQINALASGVVLTASDGLGHTGSSNPFDLVAGSIDRFVWDAVASPQTVDTPFTATVRAVNAAGVTVTGFNGLANLSAGISSEDAPIGTGTSVYSQVLITSTHDSRTQVIYLASELAGPKRITALALNINGASNETLTNFTIRLKHTSLASFSSPAWETAGWTTVYRASPVVSSAGWMTFNFTTPFDYDGSSNLLVDWSIDRASTGLTSTFIFSTSTSQAQMVYGSSASTQGDPLTWSGTVPTPISLAIRPNVKFTAIKDVPMRPPQTGNFASGIWTGPVSVPVVGAIAGLKAKSGAFSGTSNPINVSAAPAPPLGDATVFVEDFEGAALGAWWTVTGTNAYRTQSTTANTPRAGAKHLTMDCVSGLSRNEATLSVNLAGRTGVSLTFWAKEFSDEANGPPASPFVGGADFDGVAISVDGTNWYEVQDLRNLSSSYTQLTVNLDAALAARGLSYTSNFKIRFNQYDDSAIAVDGIAIDDIAITANPLTNYAVNVVAQVAENAGTTLGSVTMSPAPGTDTLVALTSSAPAKITVPASVTILAGQTSAYFTLTVLDDTIVDGSRSVAITATVSGQQPRGALVTVLDDDSLPISLTAPASIAEGAAAQTGAVTLLSPAATAVTLFLASSDTTALTVPALVTIPLGQTTATFPITAVNDTLIDGTQNATITASAAGWAGATVSVQVTDNDARTLTLNGPFSVYEGLTSTGTVSLSGTLPTHLVVTLMSSNPTQYAVPATVTIPAGQTSATFTATAVEDSATDGAQSATITASAATFTSGMATASALDNDVHRFNFSTVANPQKTGVPFTVTISARDVNNSAISVFNGSATLSAAGTGGAVAMSPAATTNFSSGSWTGSVTCHTPRANVQITAASGGATGTSNVFEVQLSPAISLAPASIELALDRGDTTTRTLAITNTGGGSLTWSIATAAPDADAAAEESDSPATAPLQSILNNLNFNAGLVRAAIPNRYAFSEGVTGNNIGDGGNDMYDGGNYLGTNLGSGLPYSDNVIATGGMLGTVGRYFTRKYDGLWVFAADVNALSYFEISGNLGADGSGSADGTELSVVRDGVTYRGFVKRVYAAGDPSVNHLIIVPDNGSVTHTYTADTDYDTHRVTNLTGVTRLYHVLYAGTTGAYIDNTATLGIMTAFLDAVSAPDWISPSPTSGSVTSGNTQNVTLTISAVDLTPGTYHRTLTVNSNDPARPSATVPVTLTVVDLPLIIVTTSAGLVASGPRGGPFTPTSQSFTVTNPSTFTVPWSVAKSVPWLHLPISGGFLAPGASTNITAMLNPMAAGLATGSHTDSLVFTNLTNGRGNTTRLVTLTVHPTAELAVAPATNLQASGPLGGPFTPGNATYTLTNTGDAALNWTAGETAPWLALSSTSGSLAPGASTQVVATIQAAATPLGSFTENIVFTNTTNGRGNTTRTATLQVYLLAPLLAAEPPITGGPGNTVSWSAVAGATTYEVQAADNLSFANAISSGWITATNFTFASLADGATWHYRVRARFTEAGATAAWSQTTSAEFATGTVVNVNTGASPGRAVLSAGTVRSENFDQAGTSWSNTLFSTLDSGAAHFSRHGLAAGSGAPATTPPLPINVGGDQEGVFLPTTGGGVQGRVVMPSHAGTIMQDSVIEGYVGIGYLDSFGSQSAMFLLRADATGQNAYAAHLARVGSAGAQLTIVRWAGGVGGPPLVSGGSFALNLANEVIKLRFSAQGSTLTASVWRVSASGGTITETPLTLSSGSNTISVIDLSYASGVAGLYCFSARPNSLTFDDIVVTGGASTYAADGSLTSVPVAPSSLVRWRDVAFHGDASAPGTAFSVDVLSAGGSLLAANVGSGTDLATIPAIASAPAIRLRANLATTNPANTPALDDWSVSWQSTLDIFFDSAWSETVQSIQDATPPSLSVTSPTVVGADAYLLAGTAGDSAGVVSVTVNGFTATSEDDFASWSLPAVLGAGSNAFSIVAQDAAVPPNVRTLNFNVTWVADVNGNGLPDDWETQYGLSDTDTAMGDRDEDGVRNMIEYVLCLDPTAPDGGPGFWTTTEMNPADGERYLVLHHRRRIGLVGWAIDVETSTNANDWSSSLGETESAQAPTPLPDGITEVAHIRLLQPIGPGGPVKAFVRLRVRSW